MFYSEKQIIPLPYIPVKDIIRVLTPEVPGAPAVEQLSLDDLAFATVLAGIRLAGVVAAFAHSTAEETVAHRLLEVEHSVVDVQQADAAHQSRGDLRPFLHAAEQPDRRLVREFSCLQEL